MYSTRSRIAAIAVCAALAFLAAPSAGRADCALTDWLFGHGQTTYAPPYSPTNPCASTPACGCAPVQCAPACQPCRPTSTYRISYRPVPTVAYMPVTSLDPCTGCAVTTYQPTRAWTYQTSYWPSSSYRVAYAPVTMGYAPCSGYSSSYGGCSSCPTSYGGCSSCSVGVGSSYVSSGGCSSCASSAPPLSTTGLPGPGDMSRPPLTGSAPAISAPVTIGSPTPAPLASPESAKTYTSGATGAPIAPGAGTGTSGSNYRGSSTSDGSPRVEPPRIDGIPPVPNSGPQLGPTSGPRTDRENHTTSRPVQQAMYFQLLKSPPASVPAQLISAPAPKASQRVDDSGWQHAQD
jgi:hypothetical protein